MSIEDPTAPLSRVFRHIEETDTYRRNRLLYVLLSHIEERVWGSFAKETYNFKEPTNRSHPIKVRHPQNSPFYGALLQKRPIILRSLLIVATP